jgi:hypothetical protein
LHKHSNLRGGKVEAAQSRRRAISRPRWFAGTFWAAQSKAPSGNNEHLEGDGAEISHACQMGLEGIVSKRRDRPYRSGPSKAWLKTKNAAAPGVLRFKDQAEP